MALVKDQKEFSHEFKVKWTTRLHDSSTWTHILTNSNTKHQLLDGKLYLFSGTITATWSMLATRKHR